MASKTFAQLASQADVQDADLLAVYRGTGPLKSVTAAILVTYLKLAGSLGSYFLQAGNNLSDLANAATARTNLGLGSAATQPSSAFAPTAAPSFTGGVTVAGGATQAGSTKIGVTALAALDIDWSANDAQTKSISANSTFTYSNFTAAKAQSVTFLLTISSAAVPTWPAATKYGGGVNPSATLGNGTHLLQLTTLDGGTTVVLTVAAKAIA